MLKFPISHHWNPKGLGSVNNFDWGDFTTDMFLYWSFFYLET